AQDGTEVRFYGGSFIAGPMGECVARAPSDAPAVLTARFDLDRVAELRRGWGVFRDRRVDLYGRLGAL
ncbi:MAG: N-carbamoylputrescine amidase, partial [Alphaproteobacteria bacterium]|nr:N-carbamoylputrescine amidase [Alphaproteobacteria bacterium]